jgi:NAD(P)-dependent dehydrogenase (short-subunit alcohol dehydrogenase family)
MKTPHRAFLVTGGASGLGAAVARALVAGGARVTLADLNHEGGHSVASELGESAFFQATDVTSESSVQQAIEASVARFGELRGVVNCAGVVAGERLLGKRGPHDFAVFEKVIRVNLFGTFNLLRFAAAAMAENQPLEDGERGVIINTASVAAFEGQIGQCAYAASKGGVASLTLPASRELARYGIRVAAIAPGIFDTPMMEAMPEEVRQSLGQQVPFPSRLGRPEEFASLALHIIENVMLNGCVLRLDGAIRMAPR